MSRDWRLLLDDILECCRRVRVYTNGMDQPAVIGNQLVYDAVLRNLEIIGEAAKGVPPEVRRQMGAIEWAKMAGMRDWLAHGYFQVNPDIVWDVITKKLPELERMLQSFIDGDGDA